MLSRTRAWLRNRYLTSWAPVEPSYKAFISYKHVSSRTFAVVLESALKGYARPLLRRPMRIFRDEKIVRVGDDLPDIIRAALAGAEYLILIASPDAARSAWVADELQQWCANLNRAERLIIVLTVGEISVDEGSRRIRWSETTALPALLSEHLTSLPLWLDLRGMAEKDWSLENLRFSDAVNSISARLRGVTPEEMNDEHVLQHRRNGRIRNGVIASVALMLAVSLVTSVLLWFSRRDLRHALDEVVLQRNTSESRRMAGLSALERAGKRLDVAVLLASEGLQFADTAEARSSLLASLEEFAGKEAIIPCPDCSISEMAFRETEEVLPRALLAVGTTRGDVLLRDLSRIDPFETTTPPLHRATVNAMAFNPQGTLLASAGVGADAQLILWKIGDSFDVKPLKLVEAHQRIGWAVAFSPDGSQLATARQDGSVVLGDVSTDGIRFRDPLFGHQGFVLTVAFSPDGHRLASGGMDGTIRMWDVAKGAPALEPLRGHRGPVGRVAFSPDGRLLASAGHDGTVRFWDASSGRASGEPLAAHRDVASSIDFAPDGASLASAGRDGAVLLWDVESRRQIGEVLRGHRGAVNRALFMSARPSAGGTMVFDGSILATAGHDGNVVLWRLSGRGHLSRTIAPGKAAVDVIAFSGGADLLATAAERTIQLFQVESGAKVGPSIATPESVAVLALSVDGSLVASGDIQGTIQISRLESGARIGEPLVGEDPLLHALAFSPDTRRLASAGQHGVVVWDVGRGQVLRELSGEHAGDVYCIAYSRDGRLFASGGRDGTIVLHDAGSLETLGTPLSGHLQGVTALAFDRSASSLMSGSFDGTVREWTLPGGEPRGTPLRLAGAPVRTIALSPDDRMLAAGAADGTITLWDLADGQAIGHPLRSHRTGLASLSFSRDGRFLASAAGDGPAVIWTVDPSAWRKLAEQLVRRNLTHEEWIRFVGSGTPYRRTFASWPSR